MTPANAPTVATPKYTMPPEWEPHERTWMAWPPESPTNADLDADGLNKVRASWAAVANAIVGFEPVTMVVDPRTSKAHEHS